MPLDRLVLIIIALLAGIGIVIWLGAVVVSALATPVGWLALLPAALLLYILWRVISERLSNSDDDHYDRIEK
ncbi:MAG: hypothetical protein P8X50_12595 [Maritimibacter sp.]|jgi:membrane protein implicated in regulation of membrane protease activity